VRDDAFDFDVHQVVVLVEIAAEVVIPFEVDVPRDDAFDFAPEVVVGDNDAVEDVVGYFDNAGVVGNAVVGGNVIHCSPAPAVVQPVVPSADVDAIAGIGAVGNTGEELNACVILLQHQKVSEGA